MNASGWVMVAAVLVAPVVAVQLQKFLEYLRERRGRQIEVFNTLMATRAHRVSPQHVAALNAIDIQFSGRRILGPWKTRTCTEVVESWKAYLDHLQPNTQDMTPEQLRSWTQRGDDLFADLLFHMGDAVGHHFDKTHLKRSIYFPRAHGEAELDQHIIRRGVADVLLNRRAIPIVVHPLIGPKAQPEPLASQDTDQPDQPDEPGEPA